MHSFLGFSAAGRRDAHQFLLQLTWGLFCRPLSPLESCNLERFGPPGGYIVLYVYSGVRNYPHFRTSGNALGASSRLAGAFWRFCLRARVTAVGVLGLAPGATRPPSRTCILQQIPPNVISGAHPLKVQQETSLVRVCLTRNFPEGFLDVLIRAITCDKQRDLVFESQLLQ